MVWILVFFLKKIDVQKDERISRISEKAAFVTFFAVLLFFASTYFAGDLLQNFGPQLISSNVLTESMMVLFYSLLVVYSIAYYYYSRKM